MTPITLPVAELKPALSGFGKIINKNRSQPVLQCLKIERTQDGWICLTATDLDRFVTLRLEQPAKGEPVSLLIPFDILQQLMKSRDKSKHLYLEAGPNNNHSIKFDLAGQLGEAKSKAPPVDEFPEVPRIKGEPIPVAENMRLAITDAMACASNDQTRYVLNGFCVDVTDPQAHYVVATDGRHLFSCNSLKLPLKKSFVVPCHKFLAWREFNLDGEWKMKVSDASDPKTEAHVQFSSRRWKFISRLITENYPNWQVCVPDPVAARTHLQINEDSLQKVIQTIQRLPNHDPKHQTMGIQWKDEQVAFLSRQEPNEPWGRNVISEARGTGSEVTYFCDRRYFVKALEYGLNTMGIVDSMSPLRFFRSGRQLVLMPVRLEQGKEEEQPSMPSSKASPRPQTQPTKTEKKPMPVTDSPTTEQVQAPSVDQIVQIISEARETITNGLNRLQDASKHLRQLQRGRRNAERGLQSVRATIQSLTRLRI